MPHDVFISHSSHDKPVADAVCAGLEGVSIRCWIAPRDVQPGRSFAGEITRAIQRSKVMVLIFSANSNTSEQVLREVQLAANSHLHIVQFRIADVLPNDDLEYYLSTPHWLDALTPPLENHLHRLGTSVKALLELAPEASANGTAGSRQAAVQRSDEPGRRAAASSLVSGPTPPVATTPFSAKRRLPKFAIVALLLGLFSIIGIGVLKFNTRLRAQKTAAPGSVATPAPTLPPEKERAELEKSFAQKVLPPQEKTTTADLGSVGIIFSDSFRRRDADRWSQSDMALGGRTPFFYLPIHGGFLFRSNALENNGLDFGGIQFATSLSGRGANIGQDLNMRVDLFVRTDTAGNTTQAGPYFRSRAAAAGDGIIGGTSAGYWVALHSTGEVKVRVLNGHPTNPIVATSRIPRDFDAQRFHTLEIAVAGRNLEVALDEQLLAFVQNGNVVASVDIPPYWLGPPSVGVNDGTAGICFAAENNRGKIGGQRAANLIVTEHRALSALPLQDQQKPATSPVSASPVTTHYAFIPQTNASSPPKVSLQQAGLEVRSASGKLLIVQVTANNMVVSHARTAVLLIEGGPTTRLELGLARPARRVFLERIGTTGGASVPTWQFEAFNSLGQLVDVVGEVHALPREPRTIALHGEGITRVVLTTDNRFGTGTWATWNCLPLSELSWEE